MLRRRSTHAQPPAVDPAREILRPIGQQLRETRLLRGEDVQDVADYLRIKPSYLVALEEGDLGAIPGRPYALGFLRSYADHLGLDGDEAVAYVKDAVRGAGGRPELNYRTPLPENRRPQGALLVLSIMLAGLVYAGWYFLDDREAPLFEAVAEVPEQLRDLAARLWVADEAEEPASPAIVDGVPAAQAALPPGAAPGERPPPAAAERALAGPPAPAPSEDPPAEAGAVPVVPAPVEAAGEPPPAAPALVAVPSEALDRAPRPPAGESPAGEPAADEPPAGLAAGPATEAAPGPVGERRVDSAADLLAALAADQGVGALRQPQVYGGDEGARVVLRARESSWIQVRSDSRDYVRTRTLQPGDSFQVPNRADLALWTGNAGGLEVVVDGRPIGPIGQSGAVMRDISLDPEQLLRRARPAP